jgi:VanZ like family
VGALWDGHAALLVSACCLPIAAVLARPLASYLRRPAAVVTAALVVAALVLPLAVGPTRWQVLVRALTEHGPGTLRLLVALVAVALAVALTLRRLGWRAASPLAIARALSWIPVLALTVLPRSGGLRWNGASSLATCLAVRGHGTVSATLVYDVLPNTLLYLPIGLLWAGAGRRWSVIAAVCVTSTSIEVHQALLTDRTCQLTDLASNGVGALAGVLLVVLLRAEAEKQAPTTTA